CDDGRGWTAAAHRRRAPHRRSRGAAASQAGPRSSGAQRDGVPADYRRTAGAMVRRRTRPALWGRIPRQRGIQSHGNLSPRAGASLAGWAHDHRRGFLGCGSVAAGRTADCAVRGTPDHWRISQAGQRDLGGFLAARPVAPARPGPLRACHHGRRAGIAARSGGVVIFAMNTGLIKMDLNCDMGELDDAAHEAALMAYITSANIACGGHAGDARTMERTARLALGRGVRIGAHPGYPDRENFGRLEIAMIPEAIADTVHAQIARLDEVVRRLGGVIVHVKPHGALYNVAVRNPEVARAIPLGVARWNPRCTLFGLAGSPMLDVWRTMGMTVAGEAFADRRYEPDGTLRSRKFPDALITDPQEAAAQALRFARQGLADTICVHGDPPGSVAILLACREALTW